MAAITAADVVVVGSGRSGLVAPYYLANAGLDMLLLEAHDKPGGMTATDPMPQATGHSTTMPRSSRSLFCLARETGFPARHLPDPMQLIEDGATVTVDGSMGLVTVIDKGTVDDFGGEHAELRTAAAVGTTA